MKMYDSVLQRVRMIEDKNGIHYAKTDGKLYKSLKVIYSAIGLYTMGINLIFIAGMFMMNYGTDNFKGIQNMLITVITCTVVLLAGYILGFFKLKVVSGIMGFISSGFLIPVFAVLMKDDLGFFGLKKSYYWRHFLPLALLAVISVIMTVIVARANLKTKKQYKKVLDNLYNLFNVGNSSDSITDLSDEQWNDFIKSYDPSNYKSIYKTINEESETTV